jgi:DNA-binding NarL/FixJ family response regulator
MSPKSAWLLQEEIVPRLKSAVPQVVCCVSAEDPAELVQDATAFAANMIQNAERAGKTVVQCASSRRGARKVKTVSAGNVCFYTLQHMKSGRRSTGSSISDVYGSATQLKGRTRLTSLDEVAATDEENGGEIFEFHDVLANNQEDPATRACRRLDWQSLCTRLAPREHSIIELMSQGKRFTSIARKLRLSVSTVQTARQHLADKILDFMGPRILDDLQIRPQWQQDIQATKAKLACREERRH